MVRSDKGPIRIIHIVGEMVRGGIETWLMHVLHLGQQIGLSIRIAYSHNDTYRLQVEAGLLDFSCFEALESQKREQNAGLSPELAILLC